MQAYEVYSSRPSSVTDVHAMDFVEQRVYPARANRDSGAASDSTFILASNDYCAIQRVVAGPEALNRIAACLCAANASHPLLKDVPALTHARIVTRYLVSILGGTKARPVTRLSHRQFDALMGNLAHALIQGQVPPATVPAILRSAERTRKKLVTKDPPCTIL